MQVPCIGRADSGGSLDLNGEQSSTGFDHEIDFRAFGGAPIKEIGSIGAGRGPGEQVADHDVFQMLAAWLGFPGQEQTGDLLVALGYAMRELAGDWAMEEE